MENKASDDKPKESKINQNLLIAIIGAATTIVATIIGAVLNRPQPPSPPPLVITATVAAPVFPTETIFPTSTLAPLPTGTAAFTFTPTFALPSETATQQIGVFNIKLATNIAGFNPTTKFKSSEIIYLLFDINDLTGVNIVNIRWSTVEVKGYKTDAEMSSSPYTVRNNHFALGFDHSANPWRAGKYKIELSMNGATETVEFEILP